MDFGTFGFLCPPGKADKARLEEFGDELALAAEINVLAMRTVWNLEVPPARQDLALGALLYIRAVRSYQAALILTQQGLAIEAQGLCRHIVECVIRTAKLAQDPGFAKVMHNEHERHRITHAENLINHERDPVLVAQFRQLAAQAKPDGAPHYETLAREVKLDVLYQSIYRGTSGFASHATVGALTRHVTPSEQGSNFAFTRQYGADTDHTLSMAIPLGIEAIGQVAILFKLPLLLDEALRLTKIWQDMCRMRPQPAFNGKS